MIKQLLSNKKTNIRRKTNKLALVFVTESFIFVDCLIRHLLMERFFSKFFFITNGLSRWSVCWRKIKKNPEGYWLNHHVSCRFFMWFVIIYGSASLTWLALHGPVYEREREGECRFPCSFMFSVYWLIQRQCWIIHIACFQIFFPSGTSKREKIISYDN